MKKKNLRTGMVVEIASGELAIVMKNTERGHILTSDGNNETQQTWAPLEYYDNDLRHTGIKDGDADIVKVFGLSGNGNMGHARVSTTGRPLLWERKETSKSKKKSDEK